MLGMCSSRPRTMSWMKVFSAAFRPSACVYLYTYLYTFSICKYLHICIHEYMYTRNRNTKTTTRTHSKSRFSSSLWSWRWAPYWGPRPLLPSVDGFEALLSCMLCTGYVRICMKRVILRTPGLDHRHELPEAGTMRYVHAHLHKHTCTYIYSHKHTQQMLVST